MNVELQVIGSALRAVAEEMGAVLVRSAFSANIKERRDRVRSIVAPLDEAGELPREGEADLRYRGQSFELTVPLGHDLAERFHAAHEERYGYADRARPIELVALRTAEIRAGPELDLRASETREVVGPALFELPGATCWVPSGWHGRTDDYGTLVLEQA